MGTHCSVQSISLPQNILKKELQDHSTNYCCIIRISIFNNLEGEECWVRMKLDSKLSVSLSQCIFSFSLFFSKSHVLAYFLSFSSLPPYLLFFFSPPLHLPFFLFPSKHLTLSTLLFKYLTFSLMLFSNSFFCPFFYRLENSVFP